MMRDTADGWTRFFGIAVFLALQFFLRCSLFCFVFFFCIAAFLYQVLSRDGGTPSLMIKEREEDWGGLDWGGLGEVRVG